jgi:hypothetical protein
MSSGPVWQRLLKRAEPEMEPPPADSTEVLQDGGLYARWYIVHRLDEELERARRYFRPLTVLLAAPTLLPGEHPTPEELEAASSAARSAARAIDMIGWVGQDRFLIVLPETMSRDAQIVMSRWRDKMWLRTRVLGGHEWVLISIENPEECKTAEECIQAGIRQLSGKAAAA